MFDGTYKQFVFLVWLFCWKADCSDSHLFYFFVLSFIKLRAPRLKYLKRIITIKYAGLCDIKPCNKAALLLCSWYTLFWIKIDQLDVICFIISLFTAQHVSNVSTSIFRSLRLIVDLSHGLYCSVIREVLALASLFSGEWLVVTCVVVLISVFL